MRKLGLQIRANEAGAAIIEFAIALPILIFFIYGIFAVGRLYEANAGIQHALGEGARYATLCLNPTSTGCTNPTDGADPGQKFRADSSVLPTPPAGAAQRS